MESHTTALLQRLKALADPVRLRLLALCSHGECSVSELTQVLSLSQPRVSQHLKQLCDADLLERFRDGHFVFYRVALRGAGAADRRQLLALLPDDEPQFERDVRRLRELRGSDDAHDADDGAVEDRALHRALIDLTVAAPLGDLIDIGSGRGRLLKLLASRSHRAVGVDTDSDARRFARAGVLLAGLPNCTLRQGDMYQLPFTDGEFDTVILDDVLVDAEDPTAALSEARRLLRHGGRLLLLAQVGDLAATDIARRFAGWCASAGLRLAQPRQVPAQDPEWLIAVATAMEQADAAA